MSILNKSLIPAATALALLTANEVRAAETDFLFQYIAAGGTVLVQFDQTAAKFDDSGWLGSSDPMGTLKGGETYAVTYSAGSFSCTGFNEYTNAVGTWTYSNAKLEWRQLSLWGRVYSFSYAGQVFDPQYGLVGAIRYQQ